MAETVVAGPGPFGPSRSAGRRRADVLALLESERHLWLASAADGDAHLIPVAFVWHKGEVLMATSAASRTARNLRAAGRTRIALGHTRDVVLIDGTVDLVSVHDVDTATAVKLATLPISPLRAPGMVCIRLRPRTVLAWRGPQEIDTRVVMRDGRWLAEPDGAAHEEEIGEDGLRLVRLTDDFACYAPEETETRFVYREIFESGQYVRDPLPTDPGQLIVDVGANIGLFSLFVKRQLPDATVVAVEPVPLLVTALRKNLARHGAEGVEVYPIALGSEPELGVGFTYYPRRPANSTRYPREKDGQVAVVARYAGEERAQRLFAAEPVIADVDTLTALLDRRRDDRPIALLKVDVEGAELAVLRGVDARHWPRVQRIAVEVYDVDGRLDAVTGLLTGQGFQVEVESVPELPPDLKMYVVRAFR